jgi:anthranilate phosphoribosyltransferase
LYAAGVAQSIEDGIVRSREALASGAARRKLDALVATTQKLAQKP